MTTPKAPCKGCEDRQVNCHSCCEKYLTYKEESEEEKRKMRENREKNNAVYLFRKAQIEKAVRKKGR